MLQITIACLVGMTFWPQASLDTFFSATLLLQVSFRFTIAVGILQREQRPEGASDYGAEIRILPDHEESRLRSFGALQSSPSTTFLSLW